MLSAVGGTEIAQLRIVEGLAWTGWAVDLLYVRRGDLWPRWQACAASTRSLRAAGLQRSDPIESVRGMLGASSAIVRSHPDVVYIHSPGDLPAALLASRLRRVPLVVHLHLPPPSRQPEWLNRLIGKAEAVVTPSVDTAERWIHVAKLRDDHVSVVPTGVDTDAFVPLAASDRDARRRGLGLDPRLPMILYTGRIDPTKGLVHLLDGARRMRQRANVVICGGSPDAGYLEQLHRQASDLHVTWLERRQEVASLLAAADLVVLPSLVHETQGMVLVEAMSCGTPAVASAVGGIPETLVAFPDHLVPPGDPAALAATMDRLVGWRRTSPQLGEAARGWVADNLSLEQTVLAVSAVLAGCAVEGRARPSRTRP